MFARGADNSFGLVTEVGGELTMGGHHLARRVNLLAVACGVRCDFRGL
jgi:hypothetical protein